LPDDPALLQQMLRAALAAIERQRLLIAALQRTRCGRRPEKLGAAAVQQGIEDAEQAVAEQTAGLEAALSQAGSAKSDEKPGRPSPRTPRTEPAKRNRGALPASLPRIEQVIDIGEKTCPSCSGSLHLIGEDRSEMLDYVPEHLRVLVIRRPRYGCRGCGEKVVQAPAPDRVITGGMATEALVAHVVVSKYADCTPLHRQVEIIARQGIDLDRSTLSNWVGRACWWLRPV
jgi:transposase